MLLLLLLPCCWAEALVLPAEVPWVVVLVGEGGGYSSASSSGAAVRGTEVGGWFVAPGAAVPV